MSNLHIILIILYIIGVVLSGYRFVSFSKQILLQEDDIRNEPTNVQKLVIAVTILLLIFAMTISWIGFISGIIHYCLDEDDEVFFIV